MSRYLPVKVEFCGALLEGVVSNGCAYVAMKPITEAMGLSWPAQLEKIKEHPALSPTVAEIAIVAEDGRRRKMICLPESRLQFWMALIQTGKVRASLRDKIIKFQIEAADVLHRAFTLGVAETNLRVIAVDRKRAAGHLMTDITLDALIFAGKEPKPHHFMNEHRLVNWALTGQFAGVEESGLDRGQIELLAALRRRNSMLIGIRMIYELRKKALEVFVAEWRSSQPALVVAA
jgi:hypothetical protein